MTQHILETSKLLRPCLPPPVFNIRAWGRTRKAEEKKKTFILSTEDSLQLILRTSAPRDSVDYHLHSGLDYSQVCVQARQSISFSPCREPALQGPSR